MTPTFERLDLGEDVTLYRGDCLDVLPTLAAGSVDAILTDLPYGTTACAWDSIIPFEPMWVIIKHVLRPGGAFVTTANQPFTSALVMSNVGWFISEWIWRKPNGTNYLNANREPLKNHESVIVFCDRYPTYNPQMLCGIPYRATSGAVGDFVRDKTVGGWITNNCGQRYPLTVLNFNKDGFEHPTQKPVALYEYLTNTYTNAGDIIMDFCMGGGTTGVAAVRLGRRFIGVEIGQGDFNIAARRIREAQLQPRLFDVPAEKPTQGRLLE